MSADLQLILGVITLLVRVVMSEYANTTISVSNNAYTARDLAAVGF